MRPTRIIIFITALVIGSILATILFQGFIKKSEVSDIEKTDTDISTQGAAGNELPLWAGYADTPYAILIISSITQETVSLSQRWNTETYRKIKVKVISTYNDVIIDDKGNQVNTQGIEEIYVTEKTIEKLMNAETILVCITSMNSNGIWYYGPITDDQGMSEYLRIENDVVQINESDFETYSFTALRILNNAIDGLQKYYMRGGETTELTQAFPAEKVEDGMKIEELNEYFCAWRNAKEVLEKMNSDNIPR